MKPLSEAIYSFSFTLITLLPSLRNRILLRPRLIVSVIPGMQNYSKEKWISTKSPNAQGQQLYIYETCWTYKIKLFNNSGYDAYYPKLSFDRVLPHSSHISILNHYVPIKANESIELEGEYVILEECLKGKNTVPEGVPKALNGITLLLGYQNYEKHQFYTAFEFKCQRNTLLRYKPSYFR
jgi:hypothetical protein